jgi:hypothetical protein
MKDRKKLVWAIVAVVLPALFFGYLFSVNMGFSLNDPDLYWHLKTGDYVLENWEVPDVDPFPFTTPRPLTTEQKIGLRSQWLGQVIFYLSYSIGGYLGVGVFRNLLIVLPMVVLYIWLLRRGVGISSAIAVISLPALFLSLQLFYAFERPQGLSFSIVLITIILLERVRRKCWEPGKDISFILLPITTALWANIHAGFLVGNLILMIYFASEILKTAYHKIRKTGKTNIRPIFYALCFISILTSFLNPNTYQLFYTYFSGLAAMFLRDFSRTITGDGASWVTDVVLEYKPLVYFYTNLNYKWLLFYWIFTAVLYLSMIVKYIFRRSFDVAEFLTVTLIVTFANYYARGLMFSLTVMPLYLGKTIIESELPKLKFKALSRGAVAAVLALSIGFCTYSYKKSPMFFRPSVTDSWVTPWYPTPLTEFLKANHIAPPMYNYYTWGGFLIWNLYPQYQVFIDGRAIDNLVNRTADSMLKLYPGWNEQLEAYHINFVVIPVIFRESGHIIPLAPALAYDDRWKLVYVKNNSVIFVRDVPKNWDIIRQFNRDKEYVFLEIIKTSNLLLSSAPGNPVFNLSKADGLLALGNVEEANKIYARFPEEVRKRKFTVRYLDFLRPLREAKR